MVSKLNFRSKRFITASILVVIVVLSLGVGGVLYTKTNQDKKNSVNKEAQQSSQLENKDKTPQGTVVKEPEKDANGLAVATNLSPPAQQSVESCKGVDELVKAKVGNGFKTVGTTQKIDDTRVEKCTSIAGKRIVSVNTYKFEDDSKLKKFETDSNNAGNSTRVKGKTLISVSVVNDTDIQRSQSEDIAESMVKSL